MTDPTLSLSTDQVAAFVELARQGTLRKAAEGLLITEQGVRNRLRGKRSFSGAAQPLHPSTDSRSTRAAARVPGRRAEDDAPWLQPPDRS